MTRRQILDDPEIGNKAEAFEAFDDIPTNPNLQRTIGDVIGWLAMLLLGAIALTRRLAHPIVDSA